MSTTRCTECDVCVRICPMNVFDTVEGGPPAIARQSDCQTCYQCEAYCPADALFVAPSRTPEPEGSSLRDENHLVRENLLGLYRERIGWRRGERNSTATGTFDYHTTADTARRPS
nr:ferredoxin family protein [Rhodococcus sp. HNM0569]